MIRSIALAAVSAVALGSAAFAADLPDTKGAPVYAPPPPVFSWNGAYVGGQVGYAWGTTTTSSFVTAAPGISVAGPSHDNSGVVGGGHVGYNYQISQFIVGVEGDVNGADYTGNGFDLLGLALSQRTAVDGSHPHLRHRRRGVRVDPQFCRPRHADDRPGRLDGRGRRRICDRQRLVGARRISLHGLRPLQSRPHQHVRRTFLRPLPR